MPDAHFWRIISYWFNFINKKEKWRRSVVSDSLWTCGLQPTRLLCPWDSPGKSTRMGCHLLQRIFLTQGLNLGLPNCRQMLYHLSYQGCPSNFINSCQLIQNICFFLGSFSVGSEGKESACDAGDLDLIPGSGKSPGEGNGYPHQYSCLENSMDRGAWQCIVRGHKESGLSN